MYQRRLNFNSKKRRYPYAKKRNYASSSKFRKANNASSYFTYDAPRAKSITRLNAAIGAELKQYVHQSNISKEALQVENITSCAAQQFDSEASHGEMPCECLMQKIVQGSTYDKRIGDKITVKSIDFRIRISLNHDHYDKQMQDLAVFIVLDRSPNGTTPKWSDIWHVSSVPDTLNQKAMKNENRFQILKTHYFPFTGPCTTGIGMAPAAKFAYYKMKKPLQIKYQAANGDLADVVENQIWICAVTASPKSATVGHTNEGPFTVHYSANVRYYDS